MESSRTVTDDKLPARTPKRVLSGSAGFGGTVQGRARRLDAPDPAEPRLGDVLVVGDFGPSHVPLLARAAALVCGGGYLTRSAVIVARELDVPLVLGVDVAKIPDGTLVSIDGAARAVEVLDG